MSGERYLDLSYGGIPLVGLVFDPTSGTLLRPENNPGPSAARVGIASTPDGNNITVLPADGSTKVTVPVAPGTLPTSEDVPSRPQQLGRYRDCGLASIVNAPGATLLALQTSPDEWLLPSWAANYRLYGVTESA